ncbi:hypothetical protein Bhyg_07660 [Pseudolycoriella hygida]|uniref:C2H2-type domain-containing protein n=1 Tax=Pseudolycoriella hygida TaxID=35572 RepID=A0A9Q0N3F6_9DIPT|nr:hypothetical protein Bhyg_07660 [Pseudolycoriella hygida]
MDENLPHNSLHMFIHAPLEQMQSEDIPNIDRDQDQPVAQVNLAEARGGTPYSCDGRGRSTFQQSSIQTHQQTHTVY